jgi:peptidoglycan hydrolase-like protein with peptidoglycan-binding domain
MPSFARTTAGVAIRVGAVLLALASPGFAAPPSVVLAKASGAYTPHASNSNKASSSQAASNKAPLTRGDVRHAEQRLADLGYWVGPVDGVLDEESHQALVAFQKISGRKTSGRLTRADLVALDRAVPPLPRELGPAHVEVDLARQVLFLVDGEGRVSDILPVSTGTGKPFSSQGYSGMADTPCGHLEVFNKLAGWKKSPLGEMYNPLYVVGGIAIHGSLDVPPHPASHGCIRVPMFASRRLPKMVALKTPVLVYGCKVDDLQPLPQATVATHSGMPAPADVAPALIALPPS